VLLLKYNFYLSIELFSGIRPFKKLFNYAYYKVYDLADIMTFIKQNDNYNDSRIEYI